MAKIKKNVRRKNQRAKINQKSKLIEVKQLEAAKLDVQMRAIKLIAAGWINAVRLCHAIEQHKRDMPRLRKSYAFEAWAERFI